MKSKRLVALVLLSVLGAVFCRANAVEKAMDLLRDADIVTGLHVGYSAKPSESAWALSVVIASSDGKKLLRSLCESETPESCFYGMVGLYVTDPVAYKELRSQLSPDDLKFTVTYQSGCVTVPMPVGLLLDNLEKTGASSYVFEASRIPDFLETIRARPPKPLTGKLIKVDFSLKGN